MSSSSSIFRVPRCCSKSTWPRCSPARSRPRGRFRSYPSSGAVVVDDGFPAQKILTALEAERPPQVDTIRLFDLYRGPGIAPGKKSLAILVLMQDTERTLTDADIDATVAGLLRILVDRFGATLRQ